MQTFATKSPDTHAQSRERRASQAPVARRALGAGVSPLGQPVLQRKEQCACGGGCPRCQTKLPIQTKLAVSQAGDVYEQEADRVAEQVMRMAEPATTEGAAVDAQAQGSRIQRMCTECEEKLHRQPIEEEEEEETLQGKEESGRIPEVTPDVQAQVNAMWGDGQPLPEPTRGFFEPRFGHNFRNVRIHTDASAAELARAVRAKAFTFGQDIVFGAGEYTPETMVGQRLLAHELAHVTQQSSARHIKRQTEQRDEKDVLVNPSAVSISIPPGMSDLSPEDLASAGREEASVARCPLVATDWSTHPESEAIAEHPYLTGMSREELGAHLKEGQPLEASVRTSMEHRYGRPLGHVRIHIDDKAAVLSERFQARAFAFGDHIAFNKDSYAPDTTEGQQLLRHEVAHALHAGPRQPGIFRQAVTCASTCPPAGALPYTLVSDTSYNCYSYARNTPSSRFLRPGAVAMTDEYKARLRDPTALAAVGGLSGLLNHFTPAGVRRNLRADLGAPISTDCSNCCSSPKRKIIAVTTEPATSLAWTGSIYSGVTSSGAGWDFHFYRKDADRAWSHKRGGLDSQRDDASGTTPICNPCNANRNHGPNYPNVVGSWCV
jgi:hypothetical protein